MSPSPFTTKKVKNKHRIEGASRGTTPRTKCRGINTRIYDNGFEHKRVSENNELKYKEWGGGVLVV